jgi:hypothetical protein
MHKLDYFSNDGRRNWAGPDPATRWSLILIGIGVGIDLIMVMAISNVLGPNDLPHPAWVFAGLLLLTAIAAVVEIVAGQVVATVNKSDLGTFGSASLKLAAVSVLCTSVSIPLFSLCVGYFGIVAISPLRYLLLKWLFDFETMEAITFTGALTVLVLLIALGLWNFR